MGSWKGISNEDRRRNGYGLMVSDNELSILQKCQEESGLSRIEFIRSALELKCGCKVFRENLHCSPHSGGK